MCRRIRISRTTVCGFVCGGGVAVVTNGSQTDPIAEKIAAGMSPRDALALSLVALDYEKDDYNTPRVCAVADKRGEGAGYLGIVRDNALLVQQMPLKPGVFFYTATYEENTLCTAQGGEFPASTLDEACDFILTGGVFAERTNPVTSVAAMATPEGFEFAAKDV